MMHMWGRVWGAEDNSEDLALSFHIEAGYRDQTQADRLYSKHIFLSELILTLGDTTAHV